MTEKQLEFDFMRNDISKVTSLDYIGGQDEDLGGYCESLIIQYSDGMEQYVLHSMAQSRELVDWKGYGNPKFGKIINNHKKAIFSSKSELLKAWNEVIEHLEIDEKLSWKETNAVCDCDCTSEEFYKTKRKDLRARVA